MDSEFFISHLLYKIKIGKITVEEACEFFPLESQNEARKILDTISFPINFEILKKIETLFFIT